jgi:HD-GYP domain-containing protein (c-di-GMP phosphodiesterase class II)
MRFVPVNCIRDGMLSGRKLLGKNGELLLNVGSVIHSSYIDKLKELGYIGIYIEDDLSNDIQISEVISQNLRFKTVKTIKNAFIMVQNGKSIPQDYINNIQSLISEIAENILSNKDLLINLIDLKVFDDYTYYHSVNVGVLSIILGAAMNLNKNQLCNLGLASMLHDIGKVFVPKDILNKPGKLANEEFETIKSHSLKGYEYLKKMHNIPIPSCTAILQHHERFDGQGYPMGTTGNKISLFGKIIAIADVYDALTSNRSYRNAIVPSEAIEYIMGGCKTLFDPALVDIFLQKIAPYPIGSCVSLSNGMIGLVTENYSDCCLRPKVKIIKHEQMEVNPYFINLKCDMSSLNITITGISDGISSSTLFPDEISETA